MKITRVGSSFLDSDPKKKFQHHVYKFAQDRKPIITPILRKSNDQDWEEGEQYLLIPNKDHILVLSMEHGQTVCKLVPNNDDEKVEGLKNNFHANNDSRMIQTATIVKQKRDYEIGRLDGEGWVVIAGFSDGMLQEWDLSLISLQSSKSSSIPPQRKFRLNVNSSGNAEISHITSPVGGEDGLLYALVKRKVSEEKLESQFLRVVIPELTSNEDDDDEDLIDLNDYTLLASFCKYLKSPTEKIEKNEKDENHQHKQFSVQTLPFALMSIRCERKGQVVNYVAIADSRGLTIYYENNVSIQSSSNICRLVRFRQHKGKSNISAAAIAPNGEDVAVGFYDGKIDILVSILSQTSSYIDDSSKSKEHPEQNLLRRTIHWHALPVKTLCYLGQPGSRASPNLLSGGEEAVVVTWNMERGLNRPSHTLPRISKGCITHIASNMYPTSTSSGTNSMDIVVRCMDNTLQLIQGHNHAVRWKIQGLACSNNECVDAVSSTDAIPSVMLQIDPKSQTPVMTRLSGAPGFLHWYDWASSQVVGELEVAPYNRISRKEEHHHAYPRPTVTHFVLSDSGNDLVTVDTMLSEVTSVGKICEVKSCIKGNNDLSEQLSLVTNIKFWSWSRDTENKSSGDQMNKGMPYDLISAMPNPHGSTGAIDGLAISPLGSRACSLSFDEGAFHIWIKGKSSNSDKTSLSPILPSWQRLCKITIPSGYSTKPAQENAQDKNSIVTFSNDGSVLAIAFGQNVTLWDHSNATLLNTIRAPDYLCDIKFVRSPLDMILTVGKSSVSIVPPFGGGYLGTDCWCYKLHENTVVDNKKIELGLVVQLTSRKAIAVAMKEMEKKGKDTLISTKIVLVDIMTGQPKQNEDGSICNWHVDGNVQCMCDISQTESKWTSEDAVLLILTENNELYVFDASSSDYNYNVERIKDRGCFSRVQNHSALSSSNAPKLQIDRKRKSDLFALNIAQSSRSPDEVSAIGKGSLIFDSSESTSLSTSQLPVLTGNFTQSFISRKFKKSKLNST